MTDELYSVWVKMKSLSIQDDQPSVSHTTSRDTISDSSLAANQKSISNQPPETRNQQPSAPKASVLDSILVYLSVPESSKSTSKASLPKHLSGEQFIQYLQEKKGKIEQAELEKAERERKKRRSVNRRRKNYKKKGERSNCKERKRSLKQKGRSKSVLMLLVVKALGVMVVVEALGVVVVVKALEVVVKALEDKVEIEVLSKVSATLKTF